MEWESDQEGKTKPTAMECTMHTTIATTSTQMEGTVHYKMRRSQMLQKVEYGLLAKI